MMNPKRNRLARSGALLLVAMLLTATTGCTSALLTAMYLTGGSDTQAEFKDLKKKRVVVVCSPQVELKFRNMNAANKIGESVGKLIQKNVSKVDVVKHDEVIDWMDNNTYEEYAEVGRALEADMVISIDLYDFDIYKGQTIFQGKGSYTLCVTDCSTGETVFEKTPDPTFWPPTGGVPASDQSESQFRNRFIKVFSDQIARTFYSHDHRAYFADDSTAFD